MAIVGVHNVSVLDSSFLRDSYSQSSSRRADGGRSSSLLQIWQEIEDEHEVSRQAQPSTDGFIGEQRHVLVLGGNETWPQSQGQNGSRDKQDELNSSGCENSSDLGDLERERVRKIFREWMNSGARDNASSISIRSNRSRVEWLGETEQERVRIIREWVQMSIKQDSREGQSAEIERVRDGLVITKNEGQSDQTRRGIRRLCGRQVLLDMLNKAERERQREVQELSGHRAVSHFPHRNRIQALLRGRFLRNDRVADKKRTTSVSDSELGLLRQKQTVSGLREGFFSERMFLVAV
ncbi:uncharacterized protein LOC129313652 [Prosopis cineraria]|uniref:uncharacterized protein LOC129313652 n=1 Tax=Prosopis cineraria TaxID=364024 RepID=UPI00240F82BA|nr:uncharacterized protein LOC129313652 [Prosopis cineraria]XP_054812905.1 uncharacterized protein LOC129313652 [Prosopis cineraria]XP_054812906.1 uncharacterized protein LOC129313652 [Prosopis cineraria]XP_054812908.1 uncharacterized protein LOC129313652 [Prosopis cineraria]